MSRARADAVGDLARHHLAHGTTSLVPTTVSDTPARLQAAVRGIALAMADAASDGPTVLGAHLEGPWLAPARAGAHAPSRLRLPDGDELAALVAAAPGAVRIVTFAPELDGSAGLLRAGLAAEVVMSVGHTDADADITAGAFAAGARHVPHLGNAMPGIDRRDPGPMAAALADRRVTLELIADGIHVHPRFLSMVGALATAVTAATATPAAVVSAAGKGHLRPGADADLVVLGDDLRALTAVSRR